MTNLYEDNFKQKEDDLYAKRAREGTIIKLDDGRRLMPLVYTRLVGTRIVEEVSELFGLYEEQTSDTWRRVDDLEYTRDGSIVKGEK